MATPDEIKTIHHIGILVSDLEAAVERWTAVTGFTFDAIARYRTDHYVDDSAPGEHLSDVRIAFSHNGPPYIELMEFFGDGTHSPELGEGVHHLGFVGLEDAAAVLAHLEEIGVGVNGRALDAGGSTILGFTVPASLNGVRLEYVSKDPQPVFTDAGVPLVINEQGLAVPIAGEDEPT